MAKRLSHDQKKEIIQKFTEGITINELSSQFECSKLTITRNLKKDLGEDEFKFLINKSKSIAKSVKDKGLKFPSENNIEFNDQFVDPDFLNNDNNISSDDHFQSTPFFEITPLNQAIESELQKDLASESIESFDFPKIAYMIVNNKIEIETKLLKDYPEWQFLPQKDLDRKTIEIFIDLKIAKSFCTKDQKVIKVPNTNVFKIVAPILSARGISRIISDKKLIAL